MDEPVNLSIEPEKVEVPIVETPPVSPVIPSPVEVPPSIPTSVVKEKKDPILFYILALMLIVAGLVFSAYNFMQKKNSQTVPVAVPTLVPRPTESVPTPTADLTANWKTYKNEKYGFEFKYPQNFQISTEGVGQYFLNQKPEIVLESDNFNYLHNQINAVFSVSAKSNAKPECDYVPRGVIDSLHYQIINGVKFTVFSESGVATGNTYSNTIYHYLKDTTCYEMVATIHESSDGSTPEALPKINEQKSHLGNRFDQILSTFKFTE